MIYSISGLLRQVAPTYCVVEACGVGYQCSASTHTLSSLPGRGQEVTLLTHLWVKEDGMELFGFSTEQERRCFRMLIGVSGVGPRVALAILSDSAPDRLMLSIAAGDAKALTRAQGVGAKLAQRIILELRDKVSDEDISMPFSDEIGTISTVAETIHNTANTQQAPRNGLNFVILWQVGINHKPPIPTKSISKRCQTFNRVSSPR